MSIEIENQETSLEIREGVIDKVRLNESGREFVKAFCDQNYDSFRSLGLGEIRSRLKEIFSSETWNFPPCKNLILNSSFLTIRRRQALENLERLTQKSSPWLETLNNIHESFFSTRSKVFFENFALIWLLGLREKVKATVNQRGVLDEEKVSQIFNALANKVNEGIKDINQTELPKKGKLNFILERALGEGGIDEFVNEELQKSQQEEQAKASEVNPQPPTLQTDHEKSTKEADTTQPQPTETQEEKKQERKNFLNKIRAFFEKPENRKQVVAAAIPLASVALGLYLRFGNIRNESQPQEISPIHTSQPHVYNLTPKAGVPTVVYSSTPGPTAVYSPTASSTPIFIPQEKIPRFPNEEKLEITPGIPVIIVSAELDLSFVPQDLKEKSSLKPTGYYQAVKEMKFFDKNTGLPIAMILKDKKDNTWVLIDSGYNGNKPLGAEEERKKIEGGVNSLLKSEEEINENLKKLQGKILDFKHGNNEGKLKIVLAVRVPHELVEEFGQNTESALEVLKRLTGGQNSPLNKGGGEIIYVFCGQGDKDKNPWWSWTRYVFVFEKVNNPQFTHDKSLNQIYP